MKNFQETEMPADTIPIYQEVREDGSSGKNEEEKLKTFIRHFSKLYPSEILEENKFSNTITVATLNTPIKSFTVKEMKTIIKTLNPKKALGNDNQSNSAKAAKNRNKFYHPTI